MGDYRCGSGDQVKRFTPSLDKRIAAALADQNASQETLVTLWDEAVTAYDDAEQTIKTETARSLDITNDDPNKSLRLIERARFLIIRRLVTDRAFMRQLKNDPETIRFFYQTIAQICRLKVHLLMD